MTIRAPDRRPRGGPNPGRLKENSRSRYWIEQILNDMKFPDGLQPTLAEISIQSARAFSTPREFRAIHIRLKEKYK